MIIFNQAITKIRVFPKTEVTNFEIRKYRKGNVILDVLLGRKKIIETFVVYRWSDEVLCRVEDFNDDKRYIEYDVIYYKPHCEICLNDKTDVDVFFETVEEMENYVNELRSKSPNIEV